MLDRYTPDSPEQWLPVPGFPDYEASGHGRIASIKRGERRILEGGKTDTGYRNVLLYSDGKRVGRRVHALVALVFHGPRPEGLEIRHLDGDKHNNAASNLAYGTHSENVRDRTRHGVKPNAENCPHSASLDEALVHRVPGRDKRYCKTCKSAYERSERRNVMMRARRAATQASAA